MSNDKGILVGFSVDWLELTCKAPLNEGANAALWSNFQQSFTETIVYGKGRNGYSNSATFGGGCIRCDWHHHPEEQARMGVHWTITGSYNQKGLRPMITIAAHFLTAYPSVAVTRIDLTYDTTGLMPVGKLASLVATAMDNGVVRRRKVKKFLSDDNVETVYYGSRASDVFLRVYDKGIETGACERNEWTRIEFSLKGQLSRAWATGYIAYKEDRQGAAWIAGEYLERTIAGLFATFFPATVTNGMGIDVWGMQPIFHSQQHKTINPYHWLFTTVASSLASKINALETIDEKIELWDAFKHEVSERIGNEDMRAVVRAKVSLRRQKQLNL